MSFQKHLMMRLAVDKLGAMDEEVCIAKLTDSGEPQLTTKSQTSVVSPFSQRMGAALRFRLKTILPFLLWTDQSR